MDSQSVIKNLEKDCQLVREETLRHYCSTRLSHKKHKQHNWGVNTGHSCVLSCFVIPEKAAGASEISFCGHIPER